MSLHRREPSLIDSFHGEEDSSEVVGPPITKNMIEGYAVLQQSNLRTCRPSEYVMTITFDDGA